MNLNTKLFYVIFFIAFIIRITFFYFYNLPPELIPDTITYAKLGRDFFEKIDLRFFNKTVTPFTQS